jgi:DNA-directed RNA polymerase specialized sigma24 family protein
MKTPKQPVTGLPMLKLVSDPYVLRRASRQAWVLVLTAGFRWDDREDLRQELLPDLLQRAPNFNPALSEWWGFVSGVMRNRATVLANRRRPLTEVFFEDLAPHERLRADSRLRTADPRTQLDSGAEVRRLVDRLPQRIKQIVELLPDYSIPEICEKTGSSRSQVYRKIRKARSCLARWGLC